MLESAQTTDMKAVVNIQVSGFFGLWITFQEALYVAGPKTRNGVFLRCLTRRGNGRQECWSIQMALLVIWRYIKSRQKHQEKLIRSLLCSGGTHCFYSATQRAALAKRTACSRCVIQQTSVVYLSLREVTAQHHLPFSTLVSRIHEDNKMAKRFRQCSAL